MGEPCCKLRLKLVCGIIQILTEEQCGVPESEIADVLRFDLEVPSGKPVVGFRFCPWCGKRIDDGPVRITDIV